ncbi:hypothetical protein FKP32DRAFT_1562393 [Trametes sanguinea]|nr:hypothetical protein FKP32DRAFT_1562393 [Trametes sanguinea]
MSGSTILILESLEQFYQRQRHWVDHARLAHEHAVDKHMNVPLADDGSASAPERFAISPPPLTRTHLVTTDVDDLYVEAFYTKATRWQRRKNRLRLKLDGLSVHHPERRPLRAHPTDSEPVTHLLKTFSDLLDARRESCQRLQRLVRDADTASYACDCRMMQRGTYLGIAL